VREGWGLKQLPRSQGKCKASNVICIFAKAILTMKMNLNLGQDEPNHEGEEGVVEVSKEPG
jgi:hypothetical protein